MVKKFSGKNSQKCEAVRQAMRRVQRVGDQRMSWAAFCKTVSKGWTNPETVKQYMKNHCMSLKPAWVDDPVERSGTRGPFGIGGALLCRGDLRVHCLEHQVELRRAHLLIRQGPLHRVVL